MDYIIIFVAKVIGFLSERLGGGTNLPGQIALKFRPGILKRLVKGYRVVLVTGTNGKTTTTAMIQNILSKTGKRAVTSPSGANMKSGVVSCLIKAFPLFSKVNGDYAVLEVDEAYMRHITSEINPEVIVVTNIFPDQLDRYGEVEQTANLIKEAIENAPESAVILNGDEPIMESLVSDRDCTYFGFETERFDNCSETETEVYCPKCRSPLKFSYMTGKEIGKYSCPVCNLTRPILSYKVKEILHADADGSEVVINNFQLRVPQAGTYNIYNAVCAIACADTLGVSCPDIIKGIESQKSKFGRQETIQIGNASVRMILIKNPAGAKEAISSCLPDKNSVSVGIVLNDNVGDGKDVSWIYDVDFECFSEMRIKNFLIGGTRAYDMAVRMKIAGFDTLSVCPTYDSLLSKLQEEEGRVYLLVTYSAMTGFRKFLHQKKIIKKLWA